MRNTSHQPSRGLEGTGTGLCFHHPLFYEFDVAVGIVVVLREVVVLAPFGEVLCKVSGTDEFQPVDFVFL